ncbi:hypothetical protein [Flavobacterium beibuense]|uniref:DUF4430 domain-containing protein n=1 Tax=Flavobacterium beibuense TaxID=657326 RepID=A0A444WA33_9FLAO|nr:hypothetical protein [Flavobacterium beibuense]RYJ42759.1 hypothetical protein NU09_1858 [Flavobacterium beibuense]
MRKYYIFLILLFSLAAANAQSFGNSEIRVDGTYDINMLIYGVWLRQGTTGNVTMRFNQTPEGITTAVNMVKKMLADNGKSMENPDIFNSFEGSDLNRRDSGKMHYSIQAGNSRINEGWILEDGSVLQLLFGACNYEVNIINAYK